MSLAFDDRGQGPVVVLLHGFPLDRSMWASQLDALSSGYRVLVPDLRGHGQSPAPIGPYPMEAMAEDVVETIDAAGVSGQFVVGGLSMGGYVALAMAERYPERLRGLMLLNTRAGADAPETARNREMTASRVEAEGSAASIASGMVEKLFVPRTRSHRPELVEAVADVMRRTPPAGVAGSLRGMAMRPDRFEVLRNLTVPVLVVAGQDDAIVPVEEARRMAETARRGELVVLPDAGHLTPLEAPDQTNEAIRAFLGRLT